MTIPIYGSACISCLVVAYYSDKLGKRAPFVFGSQLFMLVGYVMCAAPSKFIPGLTYAGCLIAACGLYPALPGLLAWSSNNYAPNAKRAVAMAIQIGAGTMGGAAASNFYKASEKPRYRTGHILELIFVALGFLSMLVYYFICKHINAKRALIPLSETSPEESRRLGDKANDYVYML
jgi:MFS family permease